MKNGRYEWRKKSSEEEEKEKKIKGSFVTLAHDGVSKRMKF